MSTNGTAPDEKRAKLDASVEDVPASKISSNTMDEKAFQAAVEEIDNCQSEIDNLNEQAAEAILAVEVKYNELRKPYYAKRAEVIAKVPEFWCTAVNILCKLLTSECKSTWIICWWQFVNHPQLSALLTEEEHKVLQYLKNFYVEEFEDIKNGYKIKLEFDTNPYFDNDVIVKEFHLDGEEPRQVVTQVKWKPGKNFLKSAAPEKDSRKRKAPDSFLSWFLGSQPSSLDEIAEVCVKKVSPLW